LAGVVRLPLPASGSKGAAEARGDCLSVVATLQWRVSELTRRRSLDAPDECWHVYCGDVRVGTIGLRTGIPHHEQPWGWACGLCPGCHPKECTDGTAEAFDQARADFKAAWRVFLSKRTEADFQTWRDQRDWTAEKYRRFDRGERMPPDWRAIG
jgi:hypothetical protein